MKLFFAVIAHLLVVSCASNRNISRNMIQMWDKAVINVEGEGYAMTEAQRNSIIDTTFKKWRSDPSLIGFSDWDLRTEIMKRLHGIRGGSHGTAIYLTDSDKYYLITAAHVLIDDIATLSWKEQIEPYKQYTDGTEKIFVYEGLKVRRRFDSPEYINTSFRSSVLSIEGFQDKDNAYSMNVAEDVAVVSLNMGASGKIWRESLDSMGYKPIRISDLNFDSKYDIGNDLMCIGFPVLSRISDPSPELKGMGIIEGSARTLPVYSWGKISLSHDSLFYFWGDISIYPGNSGGPVIHDNKIIGIVSRQASIPIEGADRKATSFSARIPFGNFIKINAIQALLREMQSREIPENMDRH